MSRKRCRNLQIEYRQFDRTHGPDCSKLGELHAMIFNPPDVLRCSPNRFAWLFIIAVLLTIGLKTGTSLVPGSMGLLSLPAAAVFTDLESLDDPTLRDDETLERY